MLTWTCAGCGLISFDKQRRCDCETNVVIPSDPEVAGCKGAWKTDPETNHEACLIRMRRLEDAARLGLEMARANDLFNTAKEIEQALSFALAETSSLPIKEKDHE